MRVLALAVLGSVWLVLVVYVVALSVDVANAEDGGEVLLLAPPVYAILSATGTGLALGIRGQIIGAGPSALRIASSVVIGAFTALISGTVLFILLTGLLSAVLGTGTEAVNGPGWWWGTVILVFVLPVALGALCVLLFVKIRPAPGMSPS